MVQDILEGLNIPWLVQVIVGAGIAGGIYLLLRVLFQKKKFAEFVGKYPVLSLFLISCVQFAQLEIANHNIFFGNMSLLNMGINILTLFAVLIVIYMVTNRAWLSIIVQEVVVTVLGVCNYYVLQYRGTPITAQDIPSVTTALNVSADLEFSLQIVASVLVVVGAGCIIYALFLRKEEVIRRKNYLWRIIFGKRFITNRIVKLQLL